MTIIKAVSHVKRYLKSVRERSSERIGSSEKFSPLYSYKMLLLHCNLSNVKQVGITTIVLSSSKLIER